MVVPSVVFAVGGSIRFHRRRSSPGEQIGTIECVCVFLEVLMAQIGRSCRFCYFFVSEWLSGRLKGTNGPNGIDPNAGFGGSSFVAPDGPGVLEDREAWLHFDAANRRPQLANRNPLG
jgi:hypothetical protein